MPKRDECTSHPFRFGSRRAKQKDWDLLFSSKGFLIVREASKPDKPVVDFVFKFELNIAPFAVLLSNSGPAATAAGQMDEKIDRRAFINITAGPVPFRSTREQNGQRLGRGLWTNQY